MRRRVAVILSILTLACVLNLPSVRGATSGTILFSEDFDAGAFPGSAWTYGDGNPASDADYWGRSEAQVHDGSGSMWCSQVGSNNESGDLNSDLSYYDTEMSAWIKHDFGSTVWKSYKTITLSFWLWCETGSLQDYFYLTAGAGRTSSVVYSQTDPTTSDWTYVEVQLPTSSTWFSFNFYSDSTYPEGGPYEGAYVDTVRLVGESSNQLISKVVNLDQYQGSMEILIPYSVLAAGSGLDHVELYFKGGTQTTFVKYTTWSNPDGAWTSSPIEFVASADGRYQFFTRAFDTTGRSEGLKTTPDAYTTVDTVKPETSVSLAGTVGFNGWYRSAVTATFTATDLESGIERVQYNIDNSGWMDALDSKATISGTGVHYFLYRSIDLAGNTETAKSLSVSVDMTPPDAVFQMANGAQFNGGTAKILWTVVGGESGLVRMEASVDGQPFHDLSVPTTSMTLTNLGNGSHYLIIKSQDVAGNTAQSRFDFLMDTQGKGILDNGKTNPLVMLGIVVLTFTIVTSTLSLARRRKKGQSPRP